MTENAIDYKEVDIEMDQEALDFIKNQGLMTVPQVFIDGVHRPHEPVYSGLLEWISKDLENTGEPKVVKRDGKVVQFNGEKIKVAIEKANSETKELTEAEVAEVAATVIQKIDKAVIEVEEIQDMVEVELMEQSFPKTAKAYIIFDDCCCFPTIFTINR